MKKNARNNLNNWKGMSLNCGRISKRRKQVLKLKPGVVDVLGVFGVPGTSTSSKFSDQLLAISGLGLLTVLYSCCKSVPLVSMSMRKRQRQRRSLSISYDLVVTEHHVRDIRRAYDDLPLTVRDLRQQHTYHTFGQYLGQRLTVRFSEGAPVLWGDAGRRVASRRVNARRRGFFTWRSCPQVSTCLRAFLITEDQLFVIHPYFTSDNVHQ